MNIDEEYKEFLITEDTPLYMIHTKLEKLSQYLMKKKYELVLKFINKIFKTEYTNLLSIKYIPKSKIKLKEKRINKAINKYKDDIIKQFNIDISKNEINQDNIFDLIHKILKVINYKVIKLEKNDDIFYSILSIKKTI